MSDRIIDYIQGGGNFLLAAHRGGNYFDTDLRNYVGISAFTGDLTIEEAVALDENLVNMPASTTVGLNSLANFVLLYASSDAIPIFAQNTAPGWHAGIRLNKTGEGTLVFISGRPYRFNIDSTKHNYNYIIENWMSGTPLSVPGDNIASVTDFSLKQNYPNPFNPKTIISYSVPEESFVTIKIFDLLGREVALLLNERKTQGVYQIEFDASGLSSGIYVYSLSSGNVLLTKKMAVLK
jgi:hypothetical protein